MRHAGKILGLVCVFVALGIAPACADINDIRWADTGIELDGGIEQIHFAQDLAGMNFSHENGDMTSFAVQGSLLTGDTMWPIFSNLYLHLDGHYAEGSLPNTSGFAIIPAMGGGLTVGFASPPQQSTSKDEMYSINGQIGHAFPVGGMFMVTPFLDLGYQEWDRQVTGIFGYQQNYSQTELMAGPLVQFSPISHLVLSLSAEAGTTIAPRVSTTWGDHTSLDDGLIYQFDGKVGYGITDHLELTANAEMRGYGYGTKPQDVITNYPTGTPNGYEVLYFAPSSYTHQLNTTVGLAYHF